MVARPQRGTYNRLIGESLTTRNIRFLHSLALDEYSAAGIGGEGPQCDDMAQGNELIKSLQAKSALSKAKYTQQMLDQYNERNFKGDHWIRLRLQVCTSTIDPARVGFLPLVKAQSSTIWDLCGTCFTSNFFRAT